MTDTLTPIRYHQPIPITVYNTPSGTDYVFVIQHNISLAFVKEADVQHLLDKRGGCCNKRRRVFAIASEDAARVWQNGGRE